MVACTYSNFTFTAWRTDYSDPGICTCTIYLCNILKALPLGRVWDGLMKIKIKKKIKRVPVPKKPPKIEKSKKAYNRKSEKTKAKKSIEEAIPNK